MRVQVLAAVLGLLGVAVAGTAHACSCAATSPDQGFARAEYVFTGTVVEQTGHTWTVAVDRVWKGADKLAERAHLLDVYDGIDCEFDFDPGRSYIFFAIVAKSSRYVYYQPEVCNWTRPLRSTRVPGPHGPVWLEDAIAETTVRAARPRPRTRGSACRSVSAATAAESGLPGRRLRLRPRGRPWEGVSC